MEDDLFRTRYSKVYTALEKVKVTLMEQKNDITAGEERSLEKTRAPLRRMTMVVACALGDLVKCEICN